MLWYFRQRAVSATAGVLLFGAALLIGGPSAIAEPATAHVHGVCKNPDSHDTRSDLDIYCAHLYTHVPPPPLLPRLTVEFKVHTNHTPQVIILVAKLYKWPAHGDHAHLYENCLRPNGDVIPCDHSWVTKDFPAPGHSDLFEFRAECQPGRYYLLFRFHGVSSSGIPEHGYWYDPHPSNKSDLTPPNRQESIYVSPAGGHQPSC